MELAEMLFDLYAHSKQRAQQADLCLNILLNIFDPAREGEIPVICVKTGLVALCGAQLEEKYRFLFTAASGSRQQMTKKDLNQLVYSWVQIPHYLQEGAAFGGVQTDATVESAFEYSSQKTHIQMGDLLKWASLEPQSIVWLPVLHRLISAETASHNVRCICCKEIGFSGFRYRSLKRFRHDLCQRCFLHGRASEQKLVHYPLVEYYNETGTGENIRDFVRTAKYKLSLKKKSKRPVLGYLPISNSLDNSLNSNNSTLNTTKSSTNFEQTNDSLHIPSSPTSPSAKESLGTPKDKTDSTDPEKSMILEYSSKLDQSSTH